MIETSGGVADGEDLRTVIRTVCCQQGTAGADEGKGNNRCTSGSQGTEEVR